tara:strand:- start:10363 stop:10533 length:171 start_codon:yes stop_codon:yes gene_type:complete
MKKIIKFEIGVLLGTVIGAVVATVVCSMCYGALGYDARDILIIQDCLQQELNDRIK